MQGLGLKTYQVGLESSVQVAVKKINARGLAIKVNAADFNRPLGKMSAQANEFTKSLEASNARVIAFGASAAIIGGVSASFAQLVIQATKVEKILADINAVLGTTADNLQKFGDGLFNVARNTSQSLEVAAEAALEFSRQGLSMEETLKRTNDALILTRLTGLKAAESVKGLTAAVNGFADVGLTTTEIINKLAAVDVKFAVSADDLVNALARAGAVAQDAGVNFDQLIGAVTAAQQITARGGAVIGNSFKTIFTRIQRSSTLDRLEELGIAVRDIRGNTLPALTVLQNLSSSYDNLAVSTKAAVAEQVGGVFQINVLKAALKDLSKETSIYSQATMTSSQASNEAYQKNAMLQKTLSSIANQTLTTVRELTANLGELTIAPALKEFLESANNILGFISDMLGAKEGESLGADFAQGIARGLGNVLAGPGMVALVLIFGKLFANALKFAKTSLQDLLQIKTVKQQELEIQEAIVAAMIDNKVLGAELLSNAGNKNKQEQILLETLRSQTKQIELQRSIARDMAPLLRASGVQGNLTVAGIKGSNKPTGKNVATGLIPNYSLKATPIEEIKEREGAKKGGYVAGQVSTMSIPKLGRVVYNKNEEVKSFEGMDQPAIMPPKNSKAGKQYEKDFSDKHGFDPYSYNGFIPNFALEAQRLAGTNILKLPKAKMITETTASNFRGEKIKGWKTLEASLDNVMKSAATYSDEFAALKEMGINVLQRQVYFSDQSSAIPSKQRKSIASQQKKLKSAKGFGNKNQHKIVGNTQEDALFKSSLQQKGYHPTWTGAYTPKGRQKGKGDENFKIDFFSPGRKPIESKYGKYTAPNLIAKSIRLYSDRYIEDFLAKQGRSDLAQKMQGKKLDDSSQMLSSLGYEDVNPEMVKRAGLFNGLIPNFANKITWDIDKKKGSYGLSSDYMGLSGFANYLSEMSKAHPEMVSPKAAQTFLDRFKKMGSQYSKDKESAKRNNPIGLGNRGSKHYSAMAGVTSSKRTVSTNNLFIKDVNKHIKHYNKHGIFAVDKVDSYDSLLSEGHIPNFMIPSKNQSNKTQDKKSNKPRKLDLSWISPSRGKGSSELRRIYKDIEQSAKTGKPYTDISAGFVVGPRIPRLLVEGHKLLNQARGRGKRIPKMRISGSMTPGKISESILENKQMLEEGDPYMSSMDYIPGEEKQVSKYLRMMGLDPSSSDMVELDEIKMFRGGFSKGFIPNFPSQNWQNQKSSGAVDDSIKEITEDKKKIEDKSGSKNHSHYSNGLVPNFNKKFTLTKGRKGSQLIDARHAYKVGRNQVFKPDPGQSPKSTKLKGRIANISKSGNSIDFDSIKPVASLSVTRISDQASSGQSIAFNTKAGHAYEKAIANTYVTKGWTGVGPAELDFFDTKWAKRNIPNQNKLKTPHGQTGPNHLTRYWKYADAYSGATHGPRLVLNKLMTKGLVSKDMIQDAVNTGSLDLTKKLPSFAEIVGVGNDSPYLSSTIFNPFATNGVNAKTFRNLTGLIKKPAYGNTDGRFGIKFNQDHFTALNKPRKSQGLIPNFANPLEDAISREKEALRERGSAADIYIDQDNRLKNPKNPAGLLVANTRDEPKSGSQGVNRAISMGMDPKTHGASGGIVPNYIGQRGAAGNRGGFNSSKGLKKLDKTANNAADSLEATGKGSTNAGKGMDEVQQNSSDLMTRMIGLTTITYALEGVMGGATEKMGAFGASMAIMNSAVQGVSQAMLLMTAVDTKGLSARGKDKYNQSKNSGKGGKMGKMAGMAGGLGMMAAGPLMGLVAVASALVPVFQSIKENTDLLDGPLDTLRKSAEKTSKGIDALGNAISAHQEIESTRNQLLELSNSSQAQTFDGEMKRLKLSGELAKQESNLASQATTLATALNLSESEIQIMTSGTAEGLKKLQEATFDYQQVLSATASMQAFTSAQGSKGYLGFGGKDADPIVQEIQKVAMARSANLGIGGDKNDVENVYKSLIGIVQQGAVDIAEVQQQREKTVPGKAPGNNRVSIRDSGTNNSTYFDVKEMGVMDEFKKSISESDLPMVLKAQVQAAIDGEMSLSDMAEFFKENSELAKEFAKAAKDTEKKYTLGQDILRQIAQERANILDNLKIETMQSENSLNLLKMDQGNMIASDNLRNKIKDSLGIMSSAATVQAQLAVKSKEIDNQYNNEIESINNQDVSARRKILQDFLNKDKGNQVFQNLNSTTTTQFSGDGRVETIQLDPDTAFDTNLISTREALARKANETQDKIVKATLLKLHSELEGVHNSDEANNKMLKVLSSEDKIAKLKENLEVLQSKELGIIHEQTDLSDLGLSIQQRITEEKKENAGAEKTLREKNLSTIEKELNLSAGGLAAAKERVSAFQDIVNPAELLSEKLHEELDAVTHTAGMTKLLSDATFATLDSQEYRQKATKAMATTLTEELTQEYKSLVTQGARIEAEAELRKNTELYAKLIAQKVKNERGAISNQITDRATTTQANLKRDESGRNTFDYRTEDEVSKLTDSTINLRAQYEANKAANFYALEATEQLTQSQTKFAEEMDRLREKIKAKGFFQEGLNAVERDGLTATANVQTAAGKVAGYAEMGNTIRGAEASVELARARKENNISNNSGDGNTLFSDTIAVRIAEANVEFERFNEVLANTTFDSVKQGLKDMVQMMGDSTKDMGDMFGQFFAGIAKAISDKLLDRATAQITTGIFELLGLNKGGIVGYNSGGYAGGGKTNQTPAMLTSGEYVVRKKVVDKLGPSTLDKINKTGSLSALYDEPNNDSFDMSTSDAGRMPPMLHMSEGGWLSKQWDKVKNFASDSLSSNGDDSSWTKIAKGTGTAFGAGYANYEDRDTSNDPEPPQAPSTARLNTASDLNIDPSSNMMSSPARQGGDSYAKQYGDYLLKKYDFDVQQQNQKVQDRAQMWSGITNSLTMAVGTAGFNQMIKGVKGLYETRGGTEKTVERWNKQGINNLGDLREKKPDAFAAYQNSINKSNKRAGVDRVTAEQLIQSDASPVAPSCAGGQCSVDSFGGSGGTNIMENMMGQGASNPSFDKRNTLLNNYEELSSGGKVRGPAGIDKVGPVMLDRGEYVIKASSVNNIEKQNPGFFDQLNAMRFNQGGIVGGDQSGGGSASPSSGNVTVNISVSSSGESSTSGGEAGDQAMAAKIKDAVVGVMSQEKRMGGMLRG
jgi:TP901 family phage tail tape measure protein